MQPAAFHAPKIWGRAGGPRGHLKIGSMVWPDTLPGAAVVLLVLATAANPHRPSEGFCQI